MIPRSDSVLRHLIETQQAIPAIKHIRAEYDLVLKAARDLYHELKQELLPRPTRASRTTPLWLWGLAFGIIVIYWIAR